MKSDKPIKELKDIVKPYTLTPTVDIPVGVNGKFRTLYRGQESELSEAEFETLLITDYAKYL